MAKIVITQDLNLSTEQLKRLAGLGELKAYDDVPKTEAEWLERVEGYDIISSGQFGLRTQYQKLNNKFISLSYVGWGFMDPEVLRRNKLIVANAPGSNKSAVVEWVVAMTINVMRDLPGTINKTAQSYDGIPPQYPGLLGAMVTILGKGAIGSLAGEVLTTLGAQIRYLSRGDDVIDCVAGADVVINMLSLNAQTSKLLNAQVFAAMKPGSYVVSITAAEILDEDALIRALDSGHIAGAAIDCGSVQVGDASDPYFTALAGHPHVLATPHIAYNTRVSARVGNDIMIDNIEAWLNHEPINLVTTYEN